MTEIRAQAALWPGPALVVDAFFLPYHLLPSQAVAKEASAEILNERTSGPSR